MSSELKECPFCGSDRLHIDYFKNGGEAQITCLHCCAVAPNRERWNTRAERTTRFELLATEVDKTGDALAVGVHCALCGFLDEEAVGADPDNWMLWRYCPSCGARVMD